MGTVMASSVAKGAPVLARDGLHKERVLIVGEEKDTCVTLRDFLKDKGFKVATAGTGTRALEIWGATRVDIAILDYGLPDGSALKLIPLLRKVDASVPIILLSGYGSLDLAVEALRLGAEQFLPKPADLSTLHELILRSLENQRNHRRTLAELSSHGKERVDPFLGKSDAVRTLADAAQHALSSDSPVLIQGEAGTGKETLARWLHHNGPRTGEPFVCLNCAKFSGDVLEDELFGGTNKGVLRPHQNRTALLDVAHKGTIFLEEIENIDFRTQAKLLKVVQEKQFRRSADTSERRVDVRLIAVIRQPLAPVILDKRLQGDLYCRAPWLHLSVPPLRERVEDIAILSTHILRTLTAELGTGSLELSSATIRALQGYTWPGNIRELKNVLERVAMASGDRAAKEGQHFEVPIEQYLTGFGQFRTLGEMERTYIQQVLHKEQGRVQSAARKLGIPRSSLYHKLKQYKTEAC